MSNNHLAFFIGLFGSLHCAVMCGPLVMSLSFPGLGPVAAGIQKMLYQAGRILSYSVLGYVAGTIGRGLNMLHLQQVLSLVTGAGLVVFAFYQITGARSRRTGRLYAVLITPIATQIGKWLSKPFGGFVAGTLHGLIPCGMVYLAMAASLNAGSSLAGAEFMMFFGLGTTPLLLVASFAPLFIRKPAISKTVFPLLFFVAGSLLLLRGMNADIPYLTMPVNSGQGAAVCK